MQFISDLLSLAIKGNCLEKTADCLRKDNSSVRAKELMMRGVPGRQSHCQECVTSINICIPSFKEADHVYVLTREQKADFAEVAQSSLTVNSLTSLLGTCH